MLPQKERLNRNDFNRFFAAGRKYHSPTLTLVYGESTNFQASAVVSKKVAKTAVERNKLRRQIYAILRDRHKEKSLAGVYIVIVKPPAQKLSFTDLRMELLTFIDRINK